MSRDPLFDATPRLLPALVVIAALIVLAGMASLHVSTLTPAGADLERVLH
jgi:hypothetical protein